MPPDPPPIPIAAGWTLEPIVFGVTFDRLLTDAVLDQANWTVRSNNLLRSFAVVTAAGNRVSLTNPGIPGAVPGPDEVIYFPPPFDLLSSLGIPAAAFSFPY